MSKPTIIQNCNFAGVHFDATAVDAVKVVAEGLLETARGLHNLTRVLNASGVTIESLLRVDAPALAPVKKRKSPTESKGK